MVGAFVRLRRALGALTKERRKARKREQRMADYASEIVWDRACQFPRRCYGSYAEYENHQRSKLNRIGSRLNRREEEDYPVFLERFRACKQLEGARSVLCLGARLGTEVKALHELGYFAVGIDLNPGPANAYVLPGDFHSLVFASESVDAVFTNCVDHVFDLEQFTLEVRRVLRPGGLFIADVMQGADEGFVPGKYESLHWNKAAEVIAEIQRIAGFECIELDTPATVRERDKLQDHVQRALLRKPKH